MSATFLRAPKSAYVFAVVVSALALTSPVSIAAQRQPAATVTVNDHRAAAGEALVKFTVKPSAEEHAQLVAQLDADEAEEIGGIGVQRFHSRRFDTETLVHYFRTRGDVEYAEPNYIIQANLLPNDPQFSQLWGLQNTGQTINGSAGTAGADIRAVSAWDVSTGSRLNVVAVIDTGIDYTHQDLAGNVWSAPSSFTVTIGGSTITCAAGTHGFNAIRKTCDPLDDNNHGSHVSGTIGAVGNNGIGVAGVNWTASIMGSKFLNAAGSGTTADAINAIEFTIQAKSAFAATSGANVRVLSNSWGGGGFSQSLLDEINKANTNNMLFVAAAGNSGSNNDTTPSYPASYNAPNVVAVAATDNKDQLASFSNYGASSVHLGAPGVNVLSTTIGNTYQMFSGTSMATPHVSGAAALILSKCSLDTAGIKSNLLNNVDKIASLSLITVTNGRLNVNSAIRACSTPTAPAAPTGLTATAGNAQVALQWTASSGATSYNVKRSTTSGAEVTIVSGVTATSYTDTAVANGTTYFYVVSAVNAVGESLNSNEASATPAAPTIPAPPTSLMATAGNAQVRLAWTASSGATSYNVKRSTTSGGEVTIAPGVTATSYTDATVTNGTTYFYVVSAVNSAGESANSNEASAKPTAPPVPATPTGLAATSGPAKKMISLSWTASSGATSYNVKRSTVNGGPYTVIATGVTSTSVVDTGLRSGTTYFYVVSAVNSSGESANSSQASAVAR